MMEAQVKDTQYSWWAHLHESHFHHYHPLHPPGEPIKRSARCLWKVESADTCVAWGGRAWVTLPSISHQVFLQSCWVIEGTDEPRIIKCHTHTFSSANIYCTNVYWGIRLLLSPLEGQISLSPALRSVWSNRHGTYTNKLAGSQGFRETQVYSKTKITWWKWSRSMVSDSLWPHGL